MPRWTYGVSLSLVLLAPLTASAFGRRAHTARSTTTYYYYPAPAVSYYTPVTVAYPPVPVVAPVPVYVAPTVAAPAAVCVPTQPAPLPAPAAGGYAVPTPAPPSTAEPPRTLPPTATPPAGKPPAVSESYYPVPAATAGTRTANYPAADTVSVGFWNMTDRDRTLSVAGRTYLLPAGKGVTLDVPRQFNWQLDDRAVETERVPADRPTAELVIRR